MAVFAAPSCIHTPGASGLLLLSGWLPAACKHVRALSSAHTDPLLERLAPPNYFLGGCVGGPALGRGRAEHWQQVLASNLMLKRVSAWIPRRNYHSMFGATWPFQGGACIHVLSGGECMDPQAELSFYDWSQHGDACPLSRWGLHREPSIPSTGNSKLCKLGK